MSKSKFIRGKGIQRNRRNRLTDGEVYQQLRNEKEKAELDTLRKRLFSDEPLDYSKRVKQ